MSIDATGLIVPVATAEHFPHRHRFVLQKVQPALMGLMDGSVSTLAPLFATAELTRKPLTAFFVGFAASVGAGISMGLAEGLSDDGKVTGRGTPTARGTITGLATIVGGMLHTFPFLTPNLKTALEFAYVVVWWSSFVAIAYIRYHIRKSPLAKTIEQVVVGKRNCLRHRVRCPAEAGGRKLEPSFDNALFGPFVDSLFRLPESLKHSDDRLTVFAVKAVFRLLGELHV